MVWKVGKAVIGEDALHTVAGDERAEKVSVSCERESRMYTAATRANQERVDEREVEMQGDDLECAP